MDLVISVIATFLSLFGQTAPTSDSAMSSGGEVLSSENYQNNDNQSVFNKLTEIDFENNTYAYHLSKIDPKNLSFSSNLETQKNSIDIKEENQCDLVVNGGFYSKENQHLGQVKSNNEQIAPALSSSLFNGFLQFDSQEVNISAVANETYTNILQTGPMIIQDTNTHKLSLTNDKPARRMVALNTDQGGFFLVLVGSDNIHSGPYLEDLPQIVKQISIQENLQVQDAINLDGGSHSVYSTNDFMIPEMNPIGSYFCLKS